jgi:ribosomal protein L7/L12
VLGLLAEGRQVAAVKAYREATGADLRTAKDAVDELARQR